VGLTPLQPGAGDAFFAVANFLAKKRGQTHFVMCEAGIRVLVLRGKWGNTTTEEKKSGAVKRPMKA
jgi:hypothetical protein